MPTQTLLLVREQFLQGRLSNGDLRAATYAWLIAKGRGARSHNADFITETELAGLIPAMVKAQSRADRDRRGDRDR